TPFPYTTLFRSLHREAQGQLEMHLCPGSPNPIVKANLVNCGTAIAHVGTLEHIDLPWPAYAEVMVADNPSIPTHAAYHDCPAILDLVVVMYPVTAADAS